MNEGDIVKAALNQVDNKVKFKTGSFVKENASL